MQNIANILLDWDLLNALLILLLASLSALLDVLAVCFYGYSSKNFFKTLKSKWKRALLGLIIVGMLSWGLFTLLVPSKGTKRHSLATFQTTPSLPVVSATDCTRIFNLPTILPTHTPSPTPTSTPTPTPAHHPPTDISLDNYGVQENQDVGTYVGTFSTDDQDTGDQHRYALVPGLGDDDNNAFNVIDARLYTKTRFDFESKNRYSIRVRSTDNSDLSYERSFAIEVINVNEPPKLDPIGNRSGEVGHLLTFTAQADDAENNELQFSLNNAPSGARIDPHSGVFSWTPSDPGTFVFTITVTETGGDPDNLSDDETITVSVSARPQPPSPSPTPLRPDCIKNSSFRFLNLEPGGRIDLTHSNIHAIQIFVDDTEFTGYIIRYHPIVPDVELAIEKWPIIWGCREPEKPCRKSLPENQRTIYVNWEWLRRDMTSGWFSLVLQVFEGGNWYCTELSPIYIAVPEP